MSLSAQQRRQLDAMEAALNAEEPELARQMRRLPGVSAGGLLAALLPLAVNILGAGVLAIGAVAAQFAVIVTGLLLGMAGPVLAVVALRVAVRARQWRQG